MALSDAEVVILTVMYAMTMLAALLGNIILIYIVWKRPAVQSLTSFMFVNMAVADLMVTVFMMPVTISQFYTDFKWMIPGLLGEITCRAIHFITHTTVMASVLCLTVMAIDRFYAFIFPLIGGTPWFRKPKCITPLIWIVSMVLMSIVPLYYKFFEEMSECGNYGFYPPGNIRGFMIYLFIVTYLVPLVVISILYGKTAHAIWFHHVPGNELKENQQHQQEISKKRAVRMLIIIVITFAICWLPGQALNLFWAVTRFSITVPDILMYLAFWLGHANSAINPWLYIALSTSIRSAFMQMLGRKPHGHLDKGSRQTTQKTRSTRVRVNEIALEHV